MMNAYYQPPPPCSIAELHRAEIVERLSPGGHTTHLDAPVAPVSAFRANPVYVGPGASDKYDWLARLDASVDLGGKDKADEGIGQRDQMRVRRDEQARQPVERHGRPAY